MPDRIDLRPLFNRPVAATMLLLARGQLNRAFRSHGLTPPDPLPIASLSKSRLSGMTPTDLDDPAARGIDKATAWFGQAFVTWSATMPATLASPVLKVLHQTHDSLTKQHGRAHETSSAVLEACEFLSRQAGLDSPAGTAVPPPRAR